MKQEVHALVLMSGGLDSTLVAALLLQQGVSVTGLSFKSCFFGVDRAQVAADRLGIPLKAVDFSQEHLVLVKDPSHGYGQAANPCLDCHALMVQQAGRFLEQSEAGGRGFDFIATGEVLGQRPFSQNKSSLRYVAKSLREGYLLRPLSARLLEPTIPEKKGWVDREQLLDIRGRGRSRQEKLAQELGITNYPQPAGGCILTDQSFGRKLKEMFARWPECTGKDVSLLRRGRCFWFDQPPIRNALIVLGRNQQENERLCALASAGDTIVELKNKPGPLGLIRYPYPKLRVGSEHPAPVERTKRLIVQYANRVAGMDEVEWEVKSLT